MSNSQTTGIAGEFLVASKLSELGNIVSLTRKNTKSIDILVSNSTASKVLAIQVKTKAKSKKEWILSKKDENLKSDNLFYIFVNLEGLEEPSIPEFHIVPSKHVVKHITGNHKEWISKPARNGQARKNDNMRKFRDKELKYKDAWHLLGL